MEEETVQADYTRLQMYNRTSYLKVSPRLRKHKDFPIKQGENYWMRIEGKTLVIGPVEKK